LVLPTNVRLGWKLKMLLVTTEKNYDLKMFKSRFRRSCKGKLMMVLPTNIRMEMKNAVPYYRKEMFTGVKCFRVDALFAARTSS
jgi:hypothetical protein